VTCYCKLSVKNEFRLFETIYFCCGIIADKVVLVGRLAAEQWQLVMAERSDILSSEELPVLADTVGMDEPEAEGRVVQSGDRAVLGDKGRRVAAELVEELGDRLVELVAGLVAVLAVPSELFE